MMPTCPPLLRHAHYRNAAHAGGRLRLWKSGYRRRRGAWTCSGASTSWPSTGSPESWGSRPHLVVTTPVGWQRPWTSRACKNGYPQATDLRYGHGRSVAPGGAVNCGPCGSKNSWNKMSSRTVVATAKAQAVQAVPSGAAVRVVAVSNGVVAAIMARGQ